MVHIRGQEKGKARSRKEAMMYDLFGLSFIEIIIGIEWVIRGAMGAKASIPYY